MSSSAPAPRQAPAHRLFLRSLFLRIWATFVVTVLVFAVCVALLVWVAVSSWDQQRTDELVERMIDDGPGLATAVVDEQHPRIIAALQALETELDAHVSVLPHVRGRRFAPPIPPPDPGRHPPPLFEQPPTRVEAQRLRRGLPITRRHRLGPPSIGLPLFEDGFHIDDPSEVDELDPLADDKAERRANRDARPQFIAIVVITPNHDPRHVWMALALLLLLTLGAGAWAIARSVTSRLAKLERSTRVLAAGDLSHRAEPRDAEPRDEIDGLAQAFNEMADRLEALLTGQRGLLANVSHELRTPISRAAVLVEILGERVESLREAVESGTSIAPEDLERVERGMAELNQDLGEVEVLIRDLLTSGRLEFGRDGALERERIVLAQLCQEAASRFGAEVRCEDGLELDGDRVLLERLLKNLLANARRACPDGKVELRARREGAELIIDVEDEGVGVPVDRRSLIFEPFARLDAARARDRGGVGLGLYLCRQIAAAHGGILRAHGRLDQRPGARFELRLPAGA